MKQDGIVSGAIFVCRTAVKDNSGRVYIIIVNWNGWRDTIECLESVFRSSYPEFRVLVCDNGSADGSLDRIKEWADGKLQVEVSPENPMHHYSSPPVPKPVGYAAYFRLEAEKGGDLSFDPPLALIDVGANLGFAGGNNVGMRYALARGDFDYIWLLNNDTVVTPDSLTSLVNRLREKPDAGMCGSTLLYYEKPENVQALGGGWYCKWIGLPWHQGRLKKAGDRIDQARVERWINYVVGASMLVSQEFMQQIGLMCEDYFLYFEETDWAIRAKGKFALAYAPLSIVYHKVGGSIGTSSNPALKSFSCDYYNVRNRLFFTRRYFPWALPTIYLTLFGTLVTRIMLGRWDRAKMIFLLLKRHFIPQKQG